MDDDLLSIITVLYLRQRESRNATPSDSDSDSDKEHELEMLHLPPKEDFLATCLLPYSSPPTAPHGSTTNFGLGPACLEQLAISAKTEESVASTATSCTHQTPISTNDCPICLENLSISPASVTISSCQHTFHEVCLKIWLEKHRTCPTCRRKLFRVPVSLARPSSEPTHSTWDEDMMGSPTIGPGLSPVTRWVIQSAGREAQMRRDRGRQEEMGARESEEGRRNSGGSGWFGWLFGRQDQSLQRRP